MPRCRAQIAYAKAQYAGLRAPSRAMSTATSVTSRAALARLPVMRKSELVDLQKAERPFGGLRSAGDAAARRAPGVRVAGPAVRAGRRRGRLLAARARTVRRGISRGRSRAQLLSRTTSRRRDRCWRSGAHALGCTVFRGGTGQTELQVQAMADLAPDGYVGTPSFLKIILEKADEQGIALPTLKKALVSGGGVSAEPARCAGRARHRGIPGLRERRSGRDRL